MPGTKPHTSPDAISPLHVRQLPSPPFGPSARLRCGSAYLLPRLSALGCLTSVACAGPTMPSADFCGAVREDCSTLSPIQDTPQISRGKLSYCRCLDAGFIKHSPPVDGGLCCRASSLRLYHTSYPVRVPRPAPSFHAAFRPHLTVTPWRFPCPSAPRTPGQETFTPKHDSMHGTHAGRQARLEAVACTPLFGAGVTATPGLPPDADSPIPSA